MEGGTISTNITLYLMLAICLVLVTVDIIEMIKLINSWALKNKIEEFFFENCIKVDLLVKTAFSVFSLLAALSALTLVVMMIISLELFVNKYLSSFLYINYVIFGLYMLGFSLFGIIHWNEVAYMCDKKNPNEKIFSVGNMFSLIGCFALSLVITFAVSIYETVSLYSDSILRRENGSKALRTIFWWFVFRGRNNEDNHPQNQRNQGGNNNQIEIENNNNNISNNERERNNIPQEERNLMNANDTGDLSNTRIEVKNGSDI